MKISDKIIGGYRITEAAELLSIIEETPREELYEECHRITRRLCGDGFDTCAIINDKNGRCPEDCKWCAQSARHHTEIDPYEVLPIEVVVAAEAKNREHGVRRFSIVSSGKRPTEGEMLRYEDQLRAMRAGGAKHLCASLGLCTEEQLSRLRRAGLETYHCNMESSPGYFGTVCTTHPQSAKEETIAAAKRVGLKVCSGGIVGMGETREDRVDFALHQAELGVGSIPINFLHPIPGTPLGERSFISPEEVLETICIFRLACPTAFLRYSGGRALLSPETERMGLYVGINSAITGGLLTTVASVVSRDRELFHSAGYDTTRETEWANG